jgi:hypothetical protein
MTTTVPEAAAAGTVAPLPLLDENPKRMGPVTRRLIKRTAAIVALLELTALVLVFGIGGERATAAGLALAFPGGGLLYDAAPVLFLLTVAATALGIVLWWAISARRARRAHGGRGRSSGDRRPVGGCGGPPAGAGRAGRADGGGPAVISMFVNCAQVWVRLVRAFHKVTGRPQVTLSRPPVLVRSSTEEVR